MTMKHRIRCFDSEILVFEANRASFNVNIQSLSNPLGFGRTLYSCDTLEEAIAAAEHFCTVFRIAREHGYYLKDHVLVRPNRHPIAVSMLMNRHISGSDWVKLLSQTADAG